MAEEHKLRGIVLDRGPFGDTSLRFDVMTAELGLVSLMHKGSRQPRKGVAPGAVLDYFATVHLRFRPARSSGMGTLLEGQLEDARWALRENPTLMAMAAVPCEILRGCTLPEHVGAERLFAHLERLLDGLTELAGERGWAKGAEPPGAPPVEAEAAELLGIGWLGLLGLLGHPPMWSRCAVSGEALGSALNGATTGLVSIADGGRVSHGAGHRGHGVRPMSLATELGIAAWMEGASALPRDGGGAWASSVQPPLNFLCAWTEYHLETRLRSYRLAVDWLFRGPGGGGASAVLGAEDAAG